MTPLALALLLGAAPADPVPSESLYALASRWTDARGAKLTLSTFRGHPVVVAMVYTSCQASCPLVVSDLQAVEAKLSPKLREQTRFVLVSFDPARDTPARLLEFATARKLDLSRWTLLTGSEDAVRELAAVLGVRYRPTGTGDYLHSNVITVLGRDGVARHRQTGLRQDPAPTVAALEASP